MTLSRFLRDYLYIPLGGNRKGEPRRYANLMATMLLGGLWHGAGWTFVCWGGLHGIYLTINHLWRELLPERPVKWLPAWMGGLAGGAITFVMVVVAWVMFRSTDMTHALIMIKAMLGIEARPIPFEDVMHGQLLVITDLRGRELAILLASALAWVWLLPNSTRVRFIKGNVMLTLAQMIATVYFLYLAIDRFGNYSPFLYFQF